MKIEVNFNSGEEKKVTPDQITYIRDLCEQSGNDFDMYDFTKMTRREASEIIDVLRLDV